MGWINMLLHEIKLGKGNERIQKIIIKYQIKL